jgi:hypothetical protein
MNEEQPPVSVFRRVATPPIELSPAARGGSLLLAAGIAASIVLAVVGSWTIWVGVLRDQPPEPVKVWYDPYEQGQAPTD